MFKKSIFNLVQQFISHLKKGEFLLGFLKPAASASFANPAFMMGHAGIEPTTIQL